MLRLNLPTPKLA